MAVAFVRGVPWPPLLLAAVFLAVGGRIPRDAGVVPRDIRAWVTGTVLALLCVGGIHVWLASRWMFVLSFFPASVSRRPVLLATVVVVAAAANAVAEEWLWRRYLFDAVQAASTWRWATVITSIRFGVAHLTAAPSGAVGVGLTAAFSVAAAFSRRLNGGSLFPAVLAHFVADVYLMASVEGVL